MLSVWGRALGATHVGKVGNSNIVQVAREAAAAGCTPQETGNRATIVLEVSSHQEAAQSKKKQNNNNRRSTDN